MMFYKSQSVEKIFKTCEAFGDNILIQEANGKSMTGNDFKKYALSYGVAFEKKGIKKGDTIILFVENQTQFAALAIASLLMGATIVLIEPTMSESTIRSKLQKIKPDRVLIEGLLFDVLSTPLQSLFSYSKFFPLLECGSQILTVNTTIMGRSKRLREKKYSNEYDYAEPLEENTSTIIVFTGGTTGGPKGVVHTNASLLYTFEQISSILSSGESVQKEIFYAELPHFLLLGIYMGVKVIVGKNTLSNTSFIKNLKKYAVSLVFTPPYRRNSILSGADTVPLGLKHILLGSAPVHSGFLEKFYAAKDAVNIQATCIYGMTEILPVAWIDGKQKIDLSKSIAGDILGYVCPDLVYEISESSELQISGSGLCSKYYGKHSMKVHQTGDLVTIEDGVLIMKGRKKDMIIRKDFNIYPSLYEPLLMRYPCVTAVALIGIWDSQLHDEKVLLLVESISTFDKKSFRDFLLKTVDSSAYPDSIVYTTLPRIGRQQKINKSLLREQYSSYFDVI